MVVDLLEQGHPLLIGDLQLSRARWEWILRRGVEVVVDSGSNVTGDALINQTKVSQGL